MAPCCASSGAVGLWFRAATLGNWLVGLGLAAVQPGRSCKTRWSFVSGSQAFRKLNSGRKLNQSDSSSVDQDEVRRFAEQAADWWKPFGPAAMLQRMNTTRIQFIRQVVSATRGHDVDEQLAAKSAVAENNRLEQASNTSLHGLRILDVGCGAGLLTESLALLGPHITAIDAAEEAIAVAQRRQDSMRALIEREQRSLQGTFQSVRATRIAERIRYRCITVEQLAQEPEHLESYDIVTALEILEHVQSPRPFLANLVRMLRPGGLLFISTLDRSAVSYLVAIGLAERLFGLLPKGTHDWRRFVQPEELCEALLTIAWSEDTPTEVIEPHRGPMEILRISGLVFDLLSGGFQLSTWTDVNYICAARKRLGMHDLSAKRERMVPLTGQVAEGVASR